MYRIIDGRAQGKTGRLLLLAKDNDAIIACSNPRAMEQKALGYGIVGLEFIPYERVMGYHYDKPVYIDEMDLFIKHVNRAIEGYTISVED